MNHTDLIDRYLRNELTENEKKQFEGLLSASDKSLEGKNLNDEMELQKEIIMAIQARGLKECLQKKETEIRAKRSQRQRIIKISSWSFASSLVAANIVNISCLSSELINSSIFLWCFESYDTITLYLLSPFLTPDIV